MPDEMIENIIDEICRVAQATQTIYNTRDRLSLEEAVLKVNEAKIKALKQIKEIYKNYIPRAEAVNDVEIDRDVWKLINDGGLMPDGIKSCENCLETNGTICGHCDGKGGIRDHYKQPKTPPNKPAGKDEMIEISVPCYVCKGTGQYEVLQGYEDCKECLNGILKVKINSSQLQKIAHENGYYKLDEVGIDRDVWKLIIEIQDGTGGSEPNVFLFTNKKEADRVYKYIKSLEGSSFYPSCPEKPKRRMEQEHILEDGEFNLFGIKDNQPPPPQISQER